MNATFQAFSAFAFRSAARPIYQLPPNRWLFGAALAALPIQMLVAPWEFGVAIAEGLILLVATEIYKAVRWRFHPTEQPGI